MQSYFRQRQSVQVGGVMALGFKGMAIGAGAMFLGTSVLAEGFRSATLGAQGLGNSGGRIAFIDDVTSITHNPANLLELPQWEAAFEPTFIHHSAQFERQGDGARASTHNPWKFIPSLFAGGPVGDGTFAFGVGVTAPFGLSVDWQPDGALRYVSPHYVAMDTVNVNPTAAFKLTDTMRLGVGLDVMWSELQLRQFTPWSMLYGNPAFPDGEGRARGDGVGIGANLGWTWEFVPGHRVAVTYRTPMDIRYDGNFTVSNVPGAGEVRAPFSSRIKFPSIVGLAYGIEVTPKFRMEANLEWLQFSRFDNLSVNVAAPLSDFSQGVPQRWRNTVTAGLGGQYQVCESWVVRAGYHFFQTPVPEHTYSPSIPDASQHAPTVGVGWRHGRHRFDLAYCFDFYETRNIRSNLNPAYLGRYEAEAHLLSAGYAFGF